MLHDYKTLAFVMKDGDVWEVKEMAPYGAHTWTNKSIPLKMELRALELMAIPYEDYVSEHLRLYQEKMAESIITRHLEPTP